MWQTISVPPLLKLDIAASQWWEIKVALCSGVSPASGSSLLGSNPTPATY